MKKKMLLIPLVLLLVMSLVATGCPAPAPAPPAPAPPKVITLKCANYFGAAASQSTVLEQFCKDVEAATGGRVKFEYYTGGTLLTAPAMYQGIVDGVADIGYSHVEYTPGRFPVTEVVDIAMGYPSAWVGAHAAMDWYYKFKPKEWDGVQVLWIHANNPSLIISKKPVRKLEDLKGLTIRAPGRVGDIIKALGGTPAPTPMGEVADAISKGVIDGVMSPYETLKTFKFADVAKYVTACWQVGSTYCFYVAMNKDAYKKLEAMPDVKAIFDRVCGEYFEIFSALMWNQIDFAGLDYGKTQGVEFIELSAAEVTKWQTAAKVAQDNYVTEMVGKGYTQAEVKGWIDYLHERIDYWTKQQILYMIPSVTGPTEMRPK